MLRNEYLTFNSGDKREKSIREGELFGGTQSTRGFSVKNKGERMRNWESGGKGFEDLSF